MGSYDNYPDGTWAGDPNAPWNEPPDDEPYFDEQEYLRDMRIRKKLCIWEDDYDD